MRFLSLRFFTKTVLLIALVFTSGYKAQCQGFGEPSNIVGVWKMILEPGTHLVSFPVLPMDATVEGVLSDQLPGGSTWDQSSRIIGLEDNGYTGSYYNSDSESWSGNLTSLYQEKAYWLIIPATEGQVSIDLAGVTMIADTLDMGTLNSGMNLVSAGFPFPTSIPGSGLIESGMSGGRYAVTSDRIYSWSAGSLNPAFHINRKGWQGADFNFEPGLGYIIVVVPGHEGFQWRRPMPDDYGQLNPGLEGQRNNLEYQNLLIPPPDFSNPPWNHDDSVEMKKSGSNKKESPNFHNRGNQGGRD